MKGDSNLANIECRVVEAETALNQVINDIYAQTNNYYIIPLEFDNACFQKAYKSPEASNVLLECRLIYKTMLLEHCRSVLNHLRHEPSS